MAFFQSAPELRHKNPRSILDLVTVIFFSMDIHPFIDFRKNLALSIQGRVTENSIHG